MRLGIISDSHLASGQKLPKVVFSIFKGVDYIIHAGDLVSLSVINQLEKVAPVKAVAGNCDNAFTVETLGREKSFEIAGLKIGLCHGDLFARAFNKNVVPEGIFKYWQNKDIDIAIFGHTHVPYCETKADMLLFNPGSISKPRQADGAPSLGIIKISAGKKPEGQIYKLPGLLK